ncbi:MAG: YihY/virulence factor BrkB family protein [Chloroflexi bacterium]|nr:YihY/virulence factor BrkB family protein [Chloroflexota bacterium]
MKTFWLLMRRTVQEYGDDNCSNMAAAISYYVLFSIVPLTIFLVSVFGLIVRNAELEQDISSELVDFLEVEEGVPLLEPDETAITERYGSEAFGEIDAAVAGLSVAEIEELAAELKDERPVTVAGFSLTEDELPVLADNVIVDALEGVSGVGGALGIIGLIGMGWAGLAMFGSIRKSLNIAWDTDVHRPVVQQKLFDLLMMVGLGTLMASSVGATMALSTLRALSADLGPFSEGTRFIWTVVPLLVPAVMSFIMFVIVYRVVPNVRHSFRDVWPGALVAAVLFEILKNGFAIYVANFNNYAGAYGALGGILLFLLFVYLSANILLIGAELAAEYPRVLRGDYDEEEAAKPAGAGIRGSARKAVRGLFLHDRDEPEAKPPSEPDA